MNFRDGKQPCDDFQPQLETSAHAVWENEHQCYKCGGVVSLCTNCHTDHHNDGYETCTVRRHIDPDGWGMHPKSDTDELDFYKNSRNILWRIPVMRKL